MAKRRKKRVRISPWVWIVLPVVFVTVFAAGMYVGLRRQDQPLAAGKSASEAGERSAVPDLTVRSPMESSEGGDDVATRPDPDELVESTETGTVESVMPVAYVALVIDDLGRSLEEVRAVGALGVPITYSVLPFEVKTPQVVAALNREGEEILCHLPMEPGNGANPGPGALTLSMSRRKLRKAVRAALDAVPGAAGVNNHMGSVFTADPRAMETVIKVLAKQEIFFLDSRTSADTLGYQVARRLGVPAVERQVFLDPDPAPQAIAFQFDRLLQIARLNGSAVGIGHPHAVTLEVLAEQIPLAREQGIEFVAVSNLVDRDHPMAD